MPKYKLRQRPKARARAAYETLVQTGIGFIQRWANAASISDKNLSLIGAATAYVESTFLGTHSAAVRRQAIALALRAAYLYGKLDGKLPEAEEPRVSA